MSQILLQFSTEIKKKKKKRERERERERNSDKVDRCGQGNDNVDFLNGAQWASLVAEMIKNLPTMQETRFLFLYLEYPLEKGMATHSSILTGKFHGQRNLAGYSPWDHKELDTIEQLTLKYVYNAKSQSV